MKIADVKERFVGRTREIGRFEEWLRDTDPEAPSILYLYDTLTDEHKKGGVGKTWLLRRFADSAENLFPSIVTVYVDFFNITDRDGVVVAQRIMTALKEAYPKWDTSNFEKSLADYTHTLQEREDASDHRNRFADAVIADLHTLDDQLNAENKRLLVFFDTYEVIQDNPLTAALRLDQAFPDDYDLSQIGFIIAGRFELDWNHPNWRGRKEDVATLPIAPFSPSEIVEYLKKLSNVNIPIDPDTIRTLHDRTEGRPILIGLVNDFLSQHIMTLTELLEIPKQIFEASLVAKVNSFEPTAPIILFMAHAYHRFNFTLLDWIMHEGELNDLLQDVERKKLPQQLLSLSFVRHPSSGGEGEDFVLHDEMRPLVKRYCWDVQDPDRRLRIILSKCVISYYENELQHLLPEQLRRAYIVELLFHKFYVDLENGYNYFAEHFFKSINLRLHSFVRALLREAKVFEKQMSPAQRYNMKYGEARQLSREESPALALALFQELEQKADPEWLEEHKASLFFEEGVAYQELSRYAEAIESFTAGMELDKQHGRMSDYAYSLNRLGTVYQKQGQLDIALQHFEESLKIHNELHNERAIANDLLSVSNVYRLQGKVEEALRRAQTSVRIRSRLFDLGKISEIFLGVSLAAIGSIYYQINDALKAEEFSQRALDIYVRTGYKKGLATIYNRLGKLSMDQGALYHAKQWFEKAYSTALGIDTESQINSLNKQGWLLVLEERYQQAIEKLQQAVDLAKEVHDDYQQVESLVDLAEALHRSGYDEQAQQIRQEARKIGLKYHYNYLLGLSHESEGDVLYKNADYKEAFSHYGEACYYMAHYNDLEYRKRLRKVTDALFEEVVPTEEIGPIIAALVAYWSSQGADKEFPDFVSSCLEVKSLLGV